MHNSIENEKSRELHDEPINGETGALKTAYLKDMAELVTGEIVENLSQEEEPERTTESDYHYSKNEDISHYFCDLMRDRVILDLGCGVQATGYKIADFTEAKKYIGIEKYFAKTALERTAQRGGKIPFEILQSDMVEYVEDISHTADIVILAGIDLTIIPESEWEKLLNGIYKILSDEGKLLIGGGSGKPWGLIGKLFQKDVALEKIESRYAQDLMSAVLPSVWKKK